MKLTLQCDNCGKVGSPEEITTDYDDRDLCLSCSNFQKVLGLQIELKGREDRIRVDTEAADRIRKEIAELSP